MNRSTKTFGHELGLSCCFRQWRAKSSHCSLLHGYALAVTLEFEATHLDERNWVVDFGSFSEIKDWLKDTFDHTLVVAEDDPHLDELKRLDQLGVAQVVIVPSVGCERFAELIGEHVNLWLARHGESDRVRLIKVEVREHGANSALWIP